MVAAADVPMDIVANVEGQNPKSNTVTARLVAMDWAYFVDDVEAVAGKLENPVSFPPGNLRPSAPRAVQSHGRLLGAARSWPRSLAMAGAVRPHRLTPGSRRRSTHPRPDLPAPLEFDLSTNPAR
jgi:hypothetical protein